MATMSSLETRVARVKPTTRSIQAITSDDSKILGRTIERQKEKTIPPVQFKTSLFKNLHSNWTPVVHKPSNEQIFKERQELVSNWFDLWTDSQRKRFLNVIFSQCKRSQLHFVQCWFNERVALKHLDPTNVLPRFLSLYIFSFLDPRSLCRAATVCCHWKFLTEQRTPAMHEHFLCTEDIRSWQDVIWMPKCSRRGWYLPYTPPDNEYGAWKRHYVACILTLDMNAPSKNRNDLYGTLADGTDTLLRSKKLNRSRQIDPATGSEILGGRPPWMPTDHNPKDLEMSSKALYQQFNPNDPQIDQSMLLFHNKFGILKSLLRCSFPGGEMQSFGLQSAARLDKHRMLEASEDNIGERPAINKAPLSRSLQLESFRETRLLELVEQPWEPPGPPKDIVPRRRDLSGGAMYALPWKHTHQQPISKSFPMEPHPRVVFISSRVPAAELLANAVLFGVIPIVYEFEGTSVEALLNQLENHLQGRSAQSIGVFVHSAVSSELRLVHGATVSLDNLDTPDFVTFFSTLAGCVLPPSSNGHVDIFAPLASCESGMEILVQLNILTGAQFTSPTGVIGGYNHINSAWLPSPEKTEPPNHYFCATKLKAWANTADQVQEACSETKQLIGRYFEQKHRDIVAQLVGQTIFDAMGQVEISGADTIGEALLDGLLHLGKTPGVDPLQYLGQFLLSKVRVTNRKTAAGYHKQPDGATIHAAAPAPPNVTTVSLSSQLELDEAFEESLGNSEATEGATGDVATEGVDGEVADINGGGKRLEKENRDGYDEDKDRDEGKAEEIREEIVTEDDDGRGRKGGKMPLLKRSRSPGRTADDLQMTFHDTSVWGDTVTTFNFTTMDQLAASDNKTPRLLTTKQLSDHPDRRSAVAREILASEVSYMRTLDIIRKVFYKPLKSALDSNRAIVSAHNLKMIFSDVLILLDLSREFVDDLRNRLSDWSVDKCLGDMFVKFSSTLKVYVNFLNNYPVLLRMIERCLEQSAIFRAFLKRHEKTVASKMLTLPELLLAPSRRINEYVTLLTWFQMHTAPNHADRSDLQAAIVTFTELNNLSQEHKLRLERERQLVALQQKIISCPSLMEANRFFIKQLDVAHLKPPSRKTDTIRPEHRTYQHCETLGLFLFNDCVVIARRTTRNFPFVRAVEHTYRFEACASLSRLRVGDIADSKYVTNALRMYTPKRSWVCATDTAEDKFNWISVIEQNIRAALDD